MRIDDMAYGHMMWPIGIWAYRHLTWRVGT